MADILIEEKRLTKEKGHISNDIGYLNNQLLITAKIQPRTEDIQQSIDEIKLKLKTKRVELNEINRKIAEIKKLKCNSSENQSEPLNE